MFNDFPPEYETHGFTKKQTSRDEKEPRSPTIVSQDTQNNKLVFVWMRMAAWHAKLYQVPAQAPGPELVTSGSKKPERIPDGAKPSYSIQLGCKTMTLYTGDATMKERDVGDPLARPIIDIDAERVFNTRSKYYDSDSPTRRFVEMYRATKAMGVEPDSLFSLTRTFDDFDGNKYKWKTTWLDHHECIRLSDNVNIASFKFDHFSYSHLGDLTIHQEVPKMTLQLLIATCGMCYELQRRRRHSRNS